jgi:hypothetical protein
MASTAEQKRKPKKTDKAQSERFKETARKLKADESIENFESTFRAIVPPKRVKQP